MEFAVGDLVTRISYNNDTVFKIIKIKNQVAYLKGVQVRLFADANLEDLQKYVEDERKIEDDFELDLDFNEDRGEYFFC